MGWMCFFPPFLPWHYCQRGVSVCNFPSLVSVECVCVYSIVKSRLDQPASRRPVKWVRGLASRQGCWVDREGVLVLEQILNLCVFVKPECSVCVPAPVNVCLYELEWKKSSQLCASCESF